ncbi:pleckstrin homology domain-containing family G member 1-like isoform X2 [Dysidea avara]
MPSLNNDGQFGSATGGEPFVCSYQKAIDENPLSPTTEQRRTKREHVIDEIISTELSYVKDLSQIIDGYQTPLVENMDSLGVTDGDILALFNNIEEIKDFNEFMLKSLQQCKDDIKQIAKCFITIWENAEGFKIYSDYCTKYPRAIEVWGKYAKHTAMTNFFKKCQQKLGHMLPLGAYLLKPVQRVLKYSLLLEKINDCLSTGEDGKEDIIAAVETMGKVGEQINEMKKKYEATVKLQEIQAQLDGWDGNDLTTYGDLVCQDTFRFLGGKPVNASIRLTTERHLFLFQRLLLMTKKKEDHFVCKQRINVEDLQVLGSIPRYPSCFQLRQISTTRVFTFQARTVSLKDDWVKVINRILVDSVDMDIPNRAKLLLFAGIPASDHHSLTPDMGKKKRHGTLDVASGKKVQKSSSFRRQNTPYDHHKARPLHVGRAESPDEAAFRSRAHTTATTTSHKSYLKSSSLLRHEKGHSKLPNVTRNDQTDAVTPSHTPVLRSRSTHASPVTDKKTDDTRRSSDITSPTLLDDDDSDEMEEGTNNSKVVKKNFSKSRHSRHNAVKRRSTSSITSPPTSPTFSVSSDDQPPANTSLPVAELENLRCVSQHSNYTSVSSAASMDDLVIAISSPDHVPTENGVYSSDLSEFPSVGIPAGRKLQESSLVVSTSDICLESRDSPVKSPVKSPIIMVDVFDDDVLSGTEDGCMSPTTELHATNGAATHDSIIAMLVKSSPNWRTHLKQQLRSLYQMLIYCHKRFSATYQQWG